MTQVPSVPSEFSRPADLLPLITIHDGVEVFFRHRLIQHRLRLQTKKDTNHTTLAAWSFPPGWSSHHQLRALMPQQCLWVVGGMRMLCGRWKAFLIVSSMYSSWMFYLYFSMLSWCFLKLDSLYHVPKRAQSKTLASCNDASLFLLGQNILNMFLDSCSGEFKVAEADARQIQANAGHFLITHMTHMLQFANQTKIHFCKWPVTLLRMAIWSISWRRCWT